MKPEHGQNSWGQLEVAGLSVEPEPNPNVHKHLPYAWAKSGSKFVKFDVPLVQKPAMKSESLRQGEARDPACGSARTGGKYSEAMHSGWMSRALIKHIGRNTSSNISPAVTTTARIMYDSALNVGDNHGEPRACLRR